VPDLLFELRCEELPPKDLAEAARSLMEGLGKELEQAGLPPTSTSAAWTPRRIAVWAHGIAERTADREERLNGPKLKAAFDAAGAPTKAAEGFARKVNVPVTELQRDAECVYAIVRTPGRPASQIVAEVLPPLPAKTKWKKTMRWGGPVEFARPIRGVVALLGGDVVACTVAGLAAGRVTRGHPFLATEDSREVRLDSASRDEYFAKLRGAFVLADPEERKAAVLASARKLVNGLEVRAALLDEVTNLVEWPTALVGRFDERFRDLPPKLLVTVMEHHQRFFPVRAADGSVEARFVAVLDRDADSVDTARRGFERVLVPRLHDASFFVAEDGKTQLADRFAKLEDVTYHKKLGTVADKGRRLGALAKHVARALGLDDAGSLQASEAGYLAKCDLATLLVGEFPELQGHVGAVYARAEGKPEAVCAAIGAQYVHDFGGVELSGPAIAVVLAENLDVLCQFGTKVGLPSGSNDPFGVRRAAITLLDACERFAPAFDVPAAIRLAGGDAAIVEYVDTRLRQRVRDAGYRFDHIDAVTSWKCAGDFRARLDDLKALSTDASFARLLEVAERCRNITKKADPSTPDVRPQLLVEAAEKSLFAAWSKARATLPAAPKPPSRADVARVAAAIADPLHEFFAKVFVNADDPAIRANRLALLREIDGTLLRFADLCRIQKS
jgi:tetrameric-type glycyl-tRNA synthetase beta subunit